MSNGSVPSVIAELAVGIAFVVIFALFIPSTGYLQTSQGYNRMQDILRDATNMKESRLFMSMYPDTHAFVQNPMIAYVDHDKNQIRFASSNNATVIFNSMSQGDNRPQNAIADPQGMQLVVYMNPLGITNAEMELRCGYWNQGFQDSIEPVYNDEVMSHLQNTDWCQIETG